jgi:hypothetical protein
LSALAIYVFFPQLNQTSDAAVYYYPETIQLLSGRVPYKDFETSYSLLFHVLFVPGVLLWRSVGAIVLTVLVLETLAIGFYLSHCRTNGDEVLDIGWRTVFLYTFSPISFYWTVVGYNSPVILFFALTSLIAAEKRQHILSGAWGASGLLFSKLLMILAWPAIVLFSRCGWARRATPLLLSIVLLMTLLSIDIDVMLPIKREFLQRTSGNIWFLISVVGFASNDGLVWRFGPIVSFGVIFVAMAVLFVCKQVRKLGTKFDLAMALFAATGVLFMLLSRKSFTFYLPMILLPLIHVFLTRNSDAVLPLVALAFLGATTTIEPHMYMEISALRAPKLFTSNNVIGLFVLDMGTVICYMYFLALCCSFGLRRSGQGLSRWRFAGAW